MSFTDHLESVLARNFSNLVLADQQPVHSDPHPFVSLIKLRSTSELFSEGSHSFNLEKMKAESGDQCRADMNRAPPNSPAPSPKSPPRCSRNNKRKLWYLSPEAWQEPQENNDDNRPQLYSLSPQFIEVIDISDSPPVPSCSTSSDKTRTNARKKPRLSDSDVDKEERSVAKQLQF